MRSDKNIKIDLSLDKTFWSFFVNNKRNLYDSIGISSVLNDNELTSFLINVCISIAFGNKRKIDFKVNINPVYEDDFFELSTAKQSKAKD